MSAVDVVRQLREWDGEGRMWQLRAAFDYSVDLDAAILLAIVAGVVEVEIEPEADDNVVRLVAP
jgi:hypothetical protein